MENYLVDFLYSINQPENRKEPLFIIKRSRLSKLLGVLLAKPPANYKPEVISDSFVEIIIPYFQNININSNNWMSPRAQKLFEKQVQQVFEVEFFEFIDDCMINDIDKLDAINIFIEKYQLSDSLTFQDRLLKKLYRSKKIIKKFPTREYKKNLL